MNHHPTIALTAGERAAIIAISGAPEGVLIRSPGGFGDGAVTLRMGRMLARRGLAEFDDPGLPGALRLTWYGRDAASVAAQ
ncbi:MAG: hypothetical protein JSR63_07980 [Proteobacteria bacterium]|nr:hypothetical protein [Pseudomonadota bacterium]